MATSNTKSSSVKHPPPRVNHQNASQKYISTKQSVWKNLITAVIGILICLQFIDLHHKEKVAIFGVIMLSWGRRQLIKTENRNEARQVFSSFAAYSTLIVSADVMRIVLGFTHVNENVLVRTTAQRLLNGQVPHALFYFLLLPIIATLCGLNVKLGKALAGYGISYLIVYSLVLRYSIDNEMLITDTFDRRVLDQCGCLSLNYSYVDNELKDNHWGDKDGNEANGITSTFNGSVLSILHDASFVLGMVYLCWTTCVFTAENESKYVSLLSANRSADLVLNHILKNSIASAATMIEVDGGESGQLPANQQLALAYLHRSMKWCASKQIINNIARGVYHSSMSLLNVRDYLSSLPLYHARRTEVRIANRELFNKQPQDHSQQETQCKCGYVSSTTCSCENIDISVEVDEQLLSIGVESVIGYLGYNNTHEVLVDVFYDSGKGKLVCRAETTLCDEVFEAVMSKKRAHRKTSQLSMWSQFKHIGSSFSSSLMTISDALLNRTVPPPPLKSGDVNHGSEEILEHLGLSCMAAQGSYEIFIDESDRRMMIDVSYPAKQSSSNHHDISTRLTCIDSLVLEEKQISVSSSVSDSSRLTQFSGSNTSAFEGINRLTSREGQVGGGEMQRISLCQSESYDRLNSENSRNSTSTDVSIEENTFPSQLRVFAIDDSEMMCKGYVKLLLPQLKADISNSEVCCPKNMSQVQQFIQHVLYGLNGSNTGSNCSISSEEDGRGEMGANIVILDQNIDFSVSSETVLGTDIARELRRRGFAGMIVIRSADDSSAFINNTLAGEVDFTLGKSDPYKHIIQKIKSAYTTNRKKKRKLVEVFSEQGACSVSNTSSTMRFKKALKVSATSFTCF